MTAKALDDPVIDKAISQRISDLGGDSAYADRSHAPLSAICARNIEGLQDSSQHHNIRARRNDDIDQVEITDFQYQTEKNIYEQLGEIQHLQRQQTQPVQKHLTSVALGVAPQDAYDEEILHE